jgi:cytosine/adenosine deaminase-related metal-dependent hydrolase
MDQVCRLSDLSPERRELIQLMQQVNFGRIEGLCITSGDPVLEPPPRVIREVKFGGENAPRAEADIRDFELKRQVHELLAQLDRIGNGVIDVLIVKHGLPFTMHVAENDGAEAA